MRKRGKRGFSLIELLVTIAIIALLGALLVPSVHSSMSSAREKADASAVENLQVVMQTAMQENALYKDAKKLADESLTDEIVLVYKVNDDNMLDFDHIEIQNDETVLTEDYAKSLLSFKEDLLGYLGGNSEPIKIESEYYRGQKYFYFTMTFPDVDYRADIDMHMSSETIGGCPHENVVETTGSATCTEPGTGVILCKACGFVSFTYTPPIPHTLVDVIEVEPTCVTAGQKSAECSVCGYKDHTEQILPLDHLFAKDSTNNNVSLWKCTRTGCSASYNEFTYDIVYKSSTGDVLQSTQRSEKEGTSVTITPDAIAGYVTPAAKSVTWNQTPPREIVFTYEPADSTYKVIHKQQTVDCSGWTVVDTEEFDAITASQVTPDTKTYTGFSAPQKQTVTIAGDGSTVVEYEYTRNTYTYTIQYVDSLGVTLKSTSMTAYYGESVKVTFPAIKGYETPATQNVVWDTAGEKTVKFTYAPATNTQYYVYHYLMNTNGSGYTLKESKTLSGTTGMEVTISPNTYEGFESPEEQKLVIGANGDSSVRLDYDRLQYTYDIVCKTPSGTVLKTVQQTEYYGSEHTIDLPEIAGYTTGRVPSVFWDSTTKKSIDVIYTPNTSTAYVVRHYQQNAAGDGYSLYATENKTGTTGASVTPEVKSYGGFDSPSTQTVTIKGDGSTVIEYMYDRKTYTVNITLGAGGASFSVTKPDGTTASGQTSLSETYRHGATLKLTPTAKTGFNSPQFKIGNTAYEPGSTITVTADTNITVFATPNSGIVYLVKHYQQNVTGDGYTLFETEDKFGAASEKVTPSVKSYTGFNSPSAQTVTIEGDGSTVVEYKYTRKTYSVTISLGTGGASFDITKPDGTTASGQTSLSGTYRYGSTFKITPIAKAGYSSPQIKVGEVEYDSGSTITITAMTDIVISATPNAGVAYVVKHYQQNVTGDGYTLYATENKTGVAGENITPAVNEYKGFNVPATQTVAIEGDGSTVVEYKYDRETYTVNITLGEGGKSFNILRTSDGVELRGQTSWSTTCRYRYAIRFEAMAQPGYRAKILELPANNELSSYVGYEIGSDVDFVVYGEPRTDTAYTVKHYQQNITGDGYTLFETENLKGTTAASVTPAVKSYAGFDVPAAQTVTINGDGSTVVEYYYTRKTYTVNITISSGATSFDVTLPDGTTATGQTTLSGLYRHGSTFKITPVAQTGYGTPQFKVGSTTYDSGDTATITANTDITVFANPSTNVVYTVKHYQQNIYDDGYTLYDTESLKGTSDASVTPAVKTYTGFDSPEEQTVTIAADGSTVVEYYYARKTFIVSATLDDNTESFSITKPDGTTAANQTSSFETYHYGATIKITAVAKDGCGNSKFVVEGASPSEFTSGSTVNVTTNMTIKVQSSSNSASYTVNHYQMNADGETYTLYETETMVGTSNTQVTPAVKEYNGFDSPSTKTVTIASDGSTTVDYRYARSEYTFTFVLYCSLTNATLGTVERTFYYGETKTINDLPSFDGYVTPEPTEWICNEPYDRTCSVFYSPSGEATYTVKHYRQDVIGEGYTLYETETLTGAVGSEITPDVKSYTGFISPDPQSATIPVGGSTVVEYKYDRETYTVNITLGEGGKSFTLRTSDSGGYLYGQTSWSATCRYRYALRIEASAQPGYRAQILELPANNNLGSYVGYEIGSDVDFVVYGEPRTDTAYTVNHYQMNVTGNGYTLFETENLKGTTATSVTPAVKSYAGFDAPAAQTVTIAGDGSTVVEYYYERNQYEVILNIGSGGSQINWDPGTGKEKSSTSQVTLNLYYGSTLELWGYSAIGYANASIRGGFDEIEDYPLNTVFTVTGNGAFEIIAEPSIVNYKVEHYLRNLDGETYTLNAENVETLEGMTGSSVTPATKTFTGFTAPATQTVTIAANGSTVVRYYYTRNTYRNLVYYRSSKTANKLQTGVISGYYGQAVETPLPSITGYTPPTGIDYFTIQASNSYYWVVPYTPIEYTITYYPSGGTMPDSYTTTYTVEDKVTLPTPTRTNHTFVAWYDNTSYSGTGRTGLTAGTTGNKTFYAKWYVKETITTRYYKSSNYIVVNVTPSVLGVESYQWTTTYTGATLNNATSASARMMFSSMNTAKTAYDNKASATCLITFSNGTSASVKVNGNGTQTFYLYPKYGY